MAAHAAPRAPLGRQLGTRSTCRSPSSPSLRAARVPARRGASRRVVALDRSREGGVGGDDGAMDTNVLYERMKALQAKEAGENTAIVEAAIEKDQAIVAGIRGDAAERPTPERTCALHHARSTSTPTFFSQVFALTVAYAFRINRRRSHTPTLSSRAQPARSTRSSSTS